MILHPRKCRDRERRECVFRVETPRHTDFDIRDFSSRPRKIEAHTDKIGVCRMGEVSKRKVRRILFTETVQLLASRHLLNVERVHIVRIDQPRLALQKEL